MPTTLKTAAESYLPAKALSRATRNEYLSTLRKWERWGGGIPIEQLRRKDIREFLDWVYEWAVKDKGTNPGRTANKAREHLRAILSWAWEQELIDTMPRFPGPRDQRDVAGRHYLTKAEINRPLLRHAQDGPPAELGRPFPHRAVLARRPGHLLQLRRRYRHRLEVRAGPRADPLAARVVGPAVTGPRDQGAVALGVAVLPPGEDRQGVLPADEPGGTCAYPEHHAGGPAPRRPGLPRRRGPAERPVPGPLQTRRHQAVRDEAGRKRDGSDIAKSGDFSACPYCQ